MNEFLESISKEQKSLREKSYKIVIEDLWHKGVKNPPLGYFNSQSAAQVKNIVPGNIYLFEYNAKMPAKIEFKNMKFEFFDAAPLVFVTSVNADRSITGINLNFCHESMKAAIMNEIVNFDPDFYMHEAQSMLSRGKTAFSPNVSKLLLSKDFENSFSKLLSLKYDSEDINVIFRNYKIERMSRLTLVELWMWPYIPFLEYKSKIREATLEMMQSAMISSKKKRKL